MSEIREINESAVKDYALECSKRFRAGKFTRVGTDFLDEIKADVEAFVRSLRSKYQTPIHPPLYTSIECPSFATGKLMEKIAQEVNETIARIVQAKVQAQPTRGVTLDRTR
jgi:hypothetical protein